MVNIEYGLRWGMDCKSGQKHFINNSGFFVFCILYLNLYLFNSRSYSEKLEKLDFIWRCTQK